ncbi:tyrosine-type recombinase/integrase, partial [Streptomyces sp. NPDC087658]|uniref:tyrosine-type recombinase/integrase n=1 Tax=Streptomyces sp. NPDC087658 TaxID=3365800 RepID=UPI0037F78CAC
LRLPHTGRDQAVPPARPRGIEIECPRSRGNFTHLHSNHCASRRTHDLRHSTATLLLEQGVELVVIKELLGHAHIGVTATVYAHVRLRLQRNAIDTLSTALDGPAGHEPTRDDGNDPPLCGAIVR